MPTPQKPVVIGAKSDTLAVSTEKHFISFKNLNPDRDGTAQVVQVTSDGEAVLQHPPADWVEEDEISIELYGKYNKAVKVAITEGGISVDLGTLSEDTSTSDVSL